MPPADSAKTQAKPPKYCASRSVITGRRPTQRVKTYIVISKPKRTSVKLGFVHGMGALLGGLKTGLKLS